MKVVFATPSLHGVTEPFKKAFEKSAPLIKKAGWKAQFVQELGCPYISNARATMTRKALDGDADVIVYLDYDLSWRPEDLLKLINTPGDVVAGTYRYKKDEEEYMGALQELPDGTPWAREDGAIKAFRVPAGFLKVTRNAIREIMKAHPELIYGFAEHPSIDLFGHGVINGVWYGEDMAFSKRWIDLGKNIILVPDLSIDHHSINTKEPKKSKVYKGNYHNFLRRQPGGNLARKKT